MEASDCRNGIIINCIVSYIIPQSLIERFMKNGTVLFGCIKVATESLRFTLLWKNLKHAKLASNKKTFRYSPGMKPKGKTVNYYPYLISYGISINLLQTWTTWKKKKKKISFASIFSIDQKVKEKWKMGNNKSCSSRCEKTFPLDLRRIPASRRMLRTNLWIPVFPWICVRISFRFAGYSEGKTALS